MSRLLKEGSSDSMEQAFEKVRAEVKRDLERESIKKLKLSQKKLVAKKKAKEIEFEIVTKDDNESTADCTEESK